MDSLIEENKKGGLIANILKQNGLVLFGIIALLYILEAAVRGNILLTDDVYFNSFGDRMSRSEIIEMNEFRSKWGWVGYLISPLFVLVRVCFAAFCLNVGSLFAGHKVGFGKWFKIAVVGELIFWLMMVLHLILMVSMDVSELTVMQTFNPFSGLSFFRGSFVPIYLLYPLQTLNIWEIGFWFFLALGAKHLLNTTYWKGFRMVSLSYVMGLLIWVITVSFLVTMQAKG